MSTFDAAAELTAIMAERRRLVRVVLWTAVVTFGATLAGLGAALG